MNKSQTQKGITLIALIITIIVLLILAVVAINSVNNNGIIKHAQNAVADYEIGQAKENEVIEGYMEYLNEYGNINNKPSVFSSITAKNYGDSITYSAGNVADWKVFYKDDNFLYIITADYLDVENLPAAVTANIDEGYPYGINFVDTTSITINDNVAEKFMLSWWKREEKSSFNNNGDYRKAIYELLNSSAWSEFAGGIMGAEAIGGPTLEMWVASWNSKGYTKLFCENQTESGYYVGTTNEATSQDVILTSDEKGYADTLYFPHTTRVNDCSGYWLASTLANDITDLYLYTINTTSGIDYIYGDGSFYLSRYKWSEVGTRPVVALPASVITTNADGTLAVIQ